MPIVRKQVECDRQQDENIALGFGFHAYGVLLWGDQAEDDEAAAPILRHSADFSSLSKPDIWPVDDFTQGEAGVDLYDMRKR